MIEFFRFTLGVIPNSKCLGLPSRNSIPSRFDSPSYVLCKSFLFRIDIPQFSHISWAVKTELGRVTQNDYSTKLHVGLGRACDGNLPYRNLLGHDGNKIM